MTKSKTHPDIEMLQIVAAKLGSMKDEVVFVGGATTTLYIDDPASPSSMATEDIDCVIELSSILSFEELERKLSKLGFKHPMDEPDAPMCRWKVGEIQVDIMPTDPKFLGFSNRWYPEGVRNRQSVTLPNGTPVFIFSVPFFVATKIEALKDRGGNDLRMSHDFEDIILVLSGNSGAKDKLVNAPDSVKQYLKNEFATLMKSPTFNEGVQAALYAAGEGEARADRVIALIIGL